LRALEVTVSGVGAALYAVFGYLTYLGIFNPTLGVVRFWPSVIIPAIIAVLFGPLTGGITGAIGIFISDMLIHGNALLSITVGVTSNFVYFYLIGYIARKKLNWTKTILGLGIGVATITLPAYLMVIAPTDMPPHIGLVYIGACAVSYVLTLLFAVSWPEWKSYGVASIIAQGIGAAIIGIGVWAFSQLFILPSGDSQLPLYAGLIQFVWVYSTEIPFLIALGPPILKACRKAFPNLTPEIEGSR